MPRTYSIDAHTFTAPPLAAGLHVVATPIGNLRDVSLRALETLAAADVLACEDTRTTGVLCARYAVATKRVSYNEHNAGAREPELLAIIEKGGSVALVSDAGTPLIQDPGARLVAAAAAREMAVASVPGPAAPVAALAASGLGGGPFLFHGFLDSKEQARRAELEALAGQSPVLVFFESPHRLAASLLSMAETLGADRRACVAREVTKLYETYHRATLGELAAHFDEVKPRGEIVVIVDGAAQTDLEPEAVLRDLLAEHGASRAAALASKLTGRPKRELYALALEMKNG